MRLWLPGYEGNMNVKFLRRVQAHRPAGDDLLRVADLFADPAQRQGLPLLFPAGGEILHLEPVSRPQRSKEPGIYEITGVAYSGTGRIAKVMVSADGGKSWAQAALQEPRLPKAFTRFRMPWRWDGGPAILQSRAWDEGGNMQPTREQFVALRGQTIEAAIGARLPEPALQRHHQLGGRRQGRGQDMSMRRVRDRCGGCGVRLRRRRGASPRAPSSASRSARPISAPGTSIVLPDGTGLPPGSGNGRPRRQIYSRNARPAMARTARAASPAG